MAFTGKATYDGGSTLPELIDDVADLVGLISPFETPLLDAIGDPRNVARSTRHEWLEDKLNPNTTLVDNVAGHGPTDTTLTVDDGSIFRVGDLVRPDGEDFLAKR